MADPVATIQVVSETLGALSSLFDALDAFVPRLISTAAIVSALLPPPDKDSPMARVRKYVDLVACNFKHAANAKAE